MNFFTSEKFLILFFSLLFFSSAWFLFAQNERVLDPNQGKSWWTLSFVIPKDKNSLDFLVENHGVETNFHYQVIAGKELLTEGSFSAKRGEQTTVSPTMTPSDTRTSIVVSLGTEKKEIYR